MIILYTFICFTLSFLISMGIPKAWLMTQPRLRQRESYLINFFNQYAKKIQLLYFGFVSKVICYLKEVFNFYYVILSKSEISMLPKLND